MEQDLKNKVIALEKLLFESKILMWVISIIGITFLIAIVGFWFTLLWTVFIK